MATGHRSSSHEEHNTISRLIVVAPVSASEETPHSYTNVTSRWRRKRREPTIALPPRIIFSTRSTISASTSRAVVATQQAHHNRLIATPPKLASWAKRRRITPNRELMTINRDPLPFSTESSVDQPKPENANQDQIGRDDIVEDTRGHQDQHSSHYGGEWLKMGDL